MGQWISPPKKRLDTQDFVCYTINNKEDTMEARTINTQLLEAQRNIGAAVKGSANPFFKSSYADLGTVMEVVKKPLNDAGLAVTQELSVKINQVTGVPFNILNTTIRSESESITSSVAVPDMKDIQKLGGAITYLKRYALQALLFVPTEDDDGNSAAGKKAPAKAKPIKSNNVPF